VSLALVCDFVLGGIALRRYGAGIVQTNNPVLPNRVDVIHAHFCEAAYRERVGLSRSRSSSLMFRLNSWLASVITMVCERWCYRPSRVRRVVCVSAGLGREISHNYPAVASLLRVIPNGVDGPGQADRDGGAAVRKQLGLADEDRLALFVGGDWHRKGLKYAIEGMAQAPNWRLAVVGSGSREPFLELARNLEVVEQLIFVGAVQNPGPYYAAADAFVFPSHYEAFSMAAIEAAAAGLPLVVPRLNGTEDYVEDGVNGWFTPRNGPDIARRLRELGSDPVARAQMGSAAARAAERFRWSQIVNEWEALYAELTTDARATHLATPDEHSVQS
jgi:glycosyltransferase involved in cell wall biosynthesis